MTDMNSKDPTAVDEIQALVRAIYPTSNDTPSLPRDAAEPSAEVPRLPRYIHFFARPFEARRRRG